MSNKKPHSIKNGVFFLGQFLNYFTVTVSVDFTVEVDVLSDTSVVAFLDAFPVDVFSPQDVIRDIVVKTTVIVKNNFFIFVLIKVIVYYT
jgi:hypothetical protein